MKKYPELQTIAAYVILFALTILILRQFWFNDLLDRANFLHWDAQHYHSIKDNGYEGFRVAFFPLFPLAWRLLHVGVYGISVINALVFLASFYFLIRELKIRKMEEIAVYLSIPGFFFFFLPYSEALFFAASTIIIIGLIRKREILVYTGLFLAVLARPAAAILFPALIIAELVNKDRDKVLFRICMYALAALGGAAIVSVIHYLDTGEWFRFFSAQRDWENELQVPQLPLTSWAGELIVRLDGFAFLIGVIAGGLLLSIMMKLNWVRNYKIDRETVFSLAYLGGITLSVLLFRGGSLFSLNRFVFAAPFIIVVFHNWINQDIQLKFKTLLLIFALVSVFWLLFGAYVHIQQIIKFTLLSMYALLLFAVRSENQRARRLSAIFLILLNFSFQVWFYARFLNGGWVG